jgi:TonB family protein
MIATRCIALIAIVACLAVSSAISSSAMGASPLENTGASPLENTGASPLEDTAASDELARAKDLYRTAAYDEALVALERIAGESDGAIRTEAHEFRLFCLIALDRKVDARAAIESMVNTDPFYQISNQASPRVRAMFRDIRQSMLPVLVQREYATAKTSFDQEDPEAADRFDRVLNLLEDPLLTPTPALADLKTVAAGFRDLSKARVRKPEPPPAAAAPPATAPAVSQSLTVNSTPAPTASEASATVPRVRAPGEAYREGDPDVAPPVTLNQQLPQWNVPIGTRPGAWQPEAALELTIDESGNVASVVLRKSFHPSYDPQLVKAAQNWKYEPARKGGVPVRFIKYVIVRLGNLN